MFVAEAAAELAFAVEGVWELVAAELLLVVHEDQWWGWLEDATATREEYRPVAVVVAAVAVAERMFVLGL